MKKILLFTVLSGFIACNSPKETNNNPSTIKQDFSNIVGNYVTESYDLRGEGYDWVAVSIVALPNNELKAVVKSRADKKKPTCSFQGILKPKGENIFVYNHDSVAVLFTFKNGKVEITTEKEQNLSVLNYFCSGGSTLAGTYAKIKGDLDKTQLKN